MARPNKEGLDYFYLSVDYGSGDAIELIETEFGAKGFRIVTKLLQRIYKKNGYYLKWTEKEKLLFAGAVGEPGSLVDEVVSRLFKWGFFDEDVFKSFEILTSNDIQNTYFDAAKRRGENLLIEEIQLCDVSEYKNVVIVNINSINDYKSTQSRVKEIKIKKNKEPAIKNDSSEKLKANGFSPGAEFFTMPLPEIHIGIQVQRIRFTQRKDVTNEQVLGMWEVFKQTYFTGKKYYENEDAIYQHFGNWIKDQKFQNDPGDKKSSRTGSERSYGQSAGAIKLAHSLAADCGITGKRGTGDSSD